MRLLILLGCFLVSPFTVADQAAIAVDNAYVRGMPPGRTVTAAFFDLHNKGARDCRLVGATADIARSGELHTHIHKDGVMRMRRVKGVDLPAGETVSFKPGGLHVMLFGVRPLKDGEPVSVTLNFEQCEPLTVGTAVRSVRR
ncbi:copper chaperone PCu(A)C [bacterium SCSIO 12696]|nr:copper chaperone PCu(A)C [bacterium SCSIO 12696]